MDARGAEALLGRLTGARVLWLLHANADPDCVGSAYALREAFGGVVGESGGVSRAGAALARSLGLEIDPWVHPEQFDLVVAVDTSSRAQLGRLAARVGAPALVDHHRYGDLLEGAPCAAWDPARSSCAEVVLATLDLAGRAPSPAACRALLAGIVTDTARFRFADASSFAAASRLLAASGASMEEVLATLAVEEDEEEGGDDASRRHAVLVAMSRASVARWGAWLAVTSEVGAYDAAAAAALVRSGADVAVVACDRAGAPRLSMRAAPRALAQGVHLGEVANAAAREVGWSGGGHAGAAGLQGASGLPAARDAVVRLLRARLEAG